MPEDYCQIVEVFNKTTGRFNQNFKCNFPDCGIVFKKSSNIRNHFKKHTGDRPFECAACSKRFSQKGNLQRHFESVHLEFFNDRFVKQEMNQKFITNPSLRAHCRYSLKVLRALKACTKDEPMKLSDVHQA